jgi:hypothetical protein
MVQQCYKWQSLLTWVQCWYILQADPGRAGVSYDKEFIVCSLDLLSGLAEGLGSSIESLVCTYLIIHWFLFIVVYGSCAERGNTYLNPYAASLILSLGTRFLQFLWDWQVPDTVCKCLKLLETHVYIFLQVSRSDLFDLLLLCCADEAPDIRQSALALLGDLAKVNIVFHFCVFCPSDLLWETCAEFSRRYCTSSICVAVIYGGLWLCAGLCSAFAASIGRLFEPCSQTAGRPFVFVSLLYG